MYEVEKIKEDLKRMLSEERYNHSLNVASVAKELAIIYNVDEEQRNKYLERQLGFKDGVADLNSDSFTTVLWNGGFNRNGILAFPALLLSLAGNREAKTTSRLAFSDEEQASPMSPFSTSKYIGDLVPALGVADSLVNALRYSYEMTNLEDYTPKQQERVRKGLKRATTELAPNYPLITDFVMSLIPTDK